MVSDVKSCLEDGFYFSYGYDLTASRQRRLSWMQQKSTEPLKLNLRQELILAQLSGKEFVSVESLSLHFDMAAQTIRRDITKL